MVSLQVLYNEYYAREQTIMIVRIHSFKYTMIPSSPIWLLLLYNVKSIHNAAKYFSCKLMLSLNVQEAADQLELQADAVTCRDVKIKLNKLSHSLKGLIQVSFMCVFRSTIGFVIV